VRRALHEGHAVRTHSWSHPEAATTGALALAREYQRGRGAAEVVLHDGMRSPVDDRARDRTATVEALPSLIAAARARGLEFTTLLEA
jgi:peptidoglycan/xylan/chitin deacetylase (PgdA/CDA1 family)